MKWLRFIGGLTGAFVAVLGLLMFLGSVTAMYVYEEESNRLGNRMTASEEDAFSRNSTIGAVIFPVGVMLYGGCVHGWFTPRAEQRPE